MTAEECRCTISILYRIGDISEMDEVGYEDCFYGDGVTLIEWVQHDRGDPAGTCEDRHDRKEPGERF